MLQKTITFLLMISFYCTTSGQETEQFSTNAFRRSNENRTEDSFPPAVATPKLIAHRGGIVAGKYTENSAPAIEAAIRRGYYMLELDLRSSRDGEIVVHHDPDFKRFYGIDRKVAGMDWTEIKSLRAQPGNSIPLRLEEAAKLCMGRIEIMVDTKEENHPESFYQKMEQILIDQGLLQNALIIGSPENRQYFLGKAKVGIDLKGLKEAIQRGEDVQKLYFLFMHGNELTPEMVAFAQKQDVLVVPSINLFHYTKEDPMTGAKRDIEALKAIGVEYFQIDSEFDQWLLKQ